VTILVGVVVPALVAVVGVVVMSRGRSSCVERRGALSSVYPIVNFISI